MIEYEERLAKYKVMMNDKGYYNKSALVSYDGEVKFIAHIVGNDDNLDVVWHKEVFVAYDILHALKKKIIDIYAIYDVGDD